MSYFLKFDGCLETSLEALEVNVFLRPCNLRHFRISVQLMFLGFVSGQAEASKGYVITESELRLNSFKVTATCCSGYSGSLSTKDMSSCRLFLGVFFVKNSFLATKSDLSHGKP